MDRHKKTTPDPTAHQITERILDKIREEFIADVREIKFSQNRALTTQEMDSLIEAYCTSYETQFSRTYLAQKLRAFKVV